MAGPQTSLVAAIVASLQDLQTVEDAGLLAKYHALASPKPMPWYEGAWVKFIDDCFYNFKSTDMVKLEPYGIDPIITGAYFDAFRKTIEVEEERMGLTVSSIAESLKSRMRELETYERTLEREIEQLRNENQRLQQENQQLRAAIGEIPGLAERFQGLRMYENKDGEETHTNEDSGAA